MQFGSLDAWWAPYLFVLITGWAMTYSWRVLGVFLGGKVSETSDLLVLIRAVATALVAAVIGNLVVFPTGAAADSSTTLRVVALLAGFMAYLLLGKRMLAGIVIGELVFVLGLYFEL